MSQYGSVQDTVFGQFLAWLAAAGQTGGAPAGVVVKDRLPGHEHAGKPLAGRLRPFRGESISSAFQT